LSKSNKWADGGGLSFSFADANLTEPNKRKQGKKLDPKPNTKHGWYWDKITSLRNEKGDWGIRERRVRGHVCGEFP